MVAHAGTPVSEIEMALSAENQRLAFEPVDFRKALATDGTPSIGSVFATNNSGPRRISVGAARDFLLGVRYVDGRGTVVKNGGRVMKNVTGYDLVKLMAGSYGTLGVLSEVSFKVLPQPETEATLLCHGLSDPVAVTVLCKAMGSPFEVSGAGHDPISGQTALRVEGFEASVAYRIAALQELLKSDVLEMSVMDADRSSPYWADQRDVANVSGEGDLWKVSCKPTEGPALAARAGAEAHMFDWAGGLIWLRVAAGTDVRARLGSFDGHATLIKSDPATVSRLVMFQPEAPGVARLSKGLRARFDPRGILNQGLMGAAA